MNHDTHVIHGDIGSHTTVHAMHLKQLESDLQPLVTAGVPCQPYSTQGHQGRHLDSRSQTCPAVLRAAHFLGSVGLLLECVPEAMTDAAMQRSVQEYAEMTGACVYQRVLHLHSCWPARRSRWLALIVPRDLAFGGFGGLPVAVPAPALKDLFPQSWPTWNASDESELEWTELEQQTFACPDYGPTDRRPNMCEPCPTALHSWGSVLYKCPCGCRESGISAQSLRRKGLRGLEIKSACWPYKSRHVHPRELQLILAFSPGQNVLSNCRAQLVLFGNAISPVQALWVVASLYHHCGLLPVGCTPEQVLRTYLQGVLAWRDLTWPSPPGTVSELILVCQGTVIQVPFNPSQTIGDLVKAEKILQERPNFSIWCDGVELPSWAFLQSRDYQLVLGTSEFLRDGMVVPVVLEHLGLRTLHLVPPGMTCSAFRSWIGIPPHARVVDSQDAEVGGDCMLLPWHTLTVQQHQDDVDFDLVMRLSGWGPDDQHVLGTHLTLSDSRCSTGLWRFDQVVRSDLLLTWIGSGFAPLACWLPSFAAAVVELWPNHADDLLRSWLSVEQTRIFAIVWEAWGWNLVCFELRSQSLQVTFFESPGLISGVASYLALRVREIANREHFLEAFQPLTIHGGGVGKLSDVLATLESVLGLPPTVVSTLRSMRVVREPFVDVADPQLSTVSPTIPFEHECQQLPLLLECGQPTGRQGLTTRFLLDFATVLAQHNPQGNDRHAILVMHEGRLWDQSGLVDVSSGLSDREVVWIFALVDSHWTLLQSFLVGDMLVMMLFDGLRQTSLSAFASVAASLKHTWGATHVHLSSTWTFPQLCNHTCGTIALAHLAHLVGAITYEQAVNFEQLHDGFAFLSGLPPYAGPQGFGAEEEAIVQSLEQILPAKGVPVDDVHNRALAAIKVFGSGPLQQALRSKNPWGALKSLGNSRPKPFTWVYYHELQHHIQERAQQKFGAHDMKKKGRKQGKPQSVTSRQLDPASLVLPPGLFHTNDGAVLPQLQLEDVQKDARGVAFSSALDAQHFLSDGKMISPEGLAILVVGPLPEGTPLGLPMHAVRVPAIYRGTNEPVILDCTSIQLGDQMVYRKTNQEAPELQVCPTKVLRVHAFKDLWEQEHTWDALTAHPVRQMVSTFPLLRLCQDKDCDERCGRFHPSLEEEGVESGLLDVWAFRWAKLDGSKATQDAAEVLSIFIRVPESSFDVLHRSSGHHGFFFEPRKDNAPGPDEDYAAIWLPQTTLADVMHRVRTVDHCVAACRLGLKYGVRCFAKHQESVHQELCPNKPFVSCAIKALYRLEPLPAGIQRASLVAMLRDSGWNAKPLQPCKGSQGQAWQVGASVDPPAPFIEAQHGWVGISKIKDATITKPAQGLIASSRTKQHIKGAAATQASGSDDPWQRGGDPWGGYQRQTPAVAVQPVHTRMEDVEAKLQDHVESKIVEEVTKLHAASDHDSRLVAVENQIQCLVANQGKLENWMVDGSSRINEVHRDCAQLQVNVQQQGQTLQQVANEVSSCTQAIGRVSNEVSGLRDNLTTHLDSYFAKQQEAMEAIINKRSRTS
eukprot:Skav206111  [mRNA]  locus=scaffold3597:185169:189815:+ [translate_table: standard]